MKNDDKQTQPPSTINELVGRLLRVSSGPVTQEIVPGRVTILTDTSNRIQSVYVDPDNPKS